MSEQTQQRFNELMQTLEELRLSLSIDSLSDEERFLTQVIIDDIEAELFEYGLKFH
jgi:hypothetical protein